MQFTVYDEEKLSRFRSPLSEGPANFEVSSAQEKVSKSGNAMMELKLRVWDINGVEGIIYDYLVDIEQMAYKIKHFWESVEFMSVYESGNFSSDDCIGKAGKCELKWKKSKNTQYPDRMVIADYIKPSNGKPEKNNENFFNDDISF